MTSFGNQLLLFIAMIHAGCCLKLCTVTKNRDDIYLRHVWAAPPLKHDRARPPLKHILAHTPPPVNKTLFIHDVI